MISQPGTQQFGLRDDMAINVEAGRNPGGSRLANEPDRCVELHCPLGPDALQVRHFSGREQLGSCFEYSLQLLSTDHDASMEAVLGQHASVRLKIKEHERFFDGIVCEFSHQGRHGRHALYRMVLRPWLWLLSQDHDCRVFQHESSIEIVKKLCQERGFSSIEESLLYSYPARDYCVQYRESSLAFISRLLEHEGIYYYFKHAQGKHTLVLADSMSAHQRVPGFETIGYAVVGDDKRKPGKIFDWASTKRVRTGKVALLDYDFDKPRADLRVGSSDPKQHAHAASEYFDYPGHYRELAVGQDRARVRIEELATTHELAEAQTNASGLFSGALFELSGHPRADQNHEYLAVGATYAIDAGAFESGDASEHTLFSSHIQALDSQVPFRPPRVTAAPIVAGAQTATVVGPTGQEIWTDKHGRVKVQFHWDRDGKRDENSSCWVRVAQAAAGAGWGALFVPRIGQEVVVEFLDGDPDQPLISGCVYNASNQPPYEPGSAQAPSGWKTRSTKGGNHNDFNELRFEDQKGSEQVVLAAQRNLTTNVKHDSTTRIGHDHKLRVQNALTLEVANGAYTTEVAKGAMSTSVPSDTYRVKAKEIVLEANGFEIHVNLQGITLKAGASELQLTPALLSLNGTLIKLNS